MERAIDPLLTIDAKLWADEFMATKQRLGDAEFDHAMMLGWFANAIMRGYDAGRDSMTHTPPHPDAQATIAALQARVQELEGITKVICGHCCEPMEIPSKAVLQSQLTQRTAERDTARRRVDELEAREVDVVMLREDLEQRTAELERVRGLVKALPKVEGEVEVYHHESGLRHSVVARPANKHYSSFDTPEEAEAYASLLKHRQGMEG